MGVIYKGLNFDGVNSLDYGIYITGEGVYNAPTRDVEAIEVPGRNGDFILDKGRFSNISVTYKAGTFAQSQTEFAEKLSEFRNAILSRVGYKRLEDDYHPDEFRMAIYTNGLEVGPVHYSEAGEFELTFNCKPQRFLKSGETAQTVESGGAITNPTPFEAQPLLLLDGYGNIEIEGKKIAVSGEPLGEIKLVNSGTLQSREIYLRFTEGNAAKLNAGDVITVAKTNVNMRHEVKNEYLGSQSFVSITITGTSQASGSSVVLGDGLGFTLDAAIPADSFQFGTPSTIVHAVNFTAVISDNGTQRSYNQVLRYTVEYDGAREIKGTVFYLSYIFANASQTVSVGATTAESTKLVGNNIYIDLDLGEAYKIIDGAVASVNNIVSLPARLPVLKSGANNITYDNTITSLKITPRWWKI